ncbi:hypothetical protein GLE_5378 [Lysobacter enzymogenes]|uniref:Uncharacterized protein n=1 Tax=Lysobacter enzymogenes TaxID=69 RepID=A0A0S2DQX9_LYSEN|nr:hypothetical protein [Lysobacter enzymogenes]ALN60719.1 hypothetical protein GLE_5378 [Lysobacter enzymogenes]
MKTRTWTPALAIAVAALLAAPAPAAVAATQDDGTTLTLYTGRVGTRAVTMYLQDEPAPCGGILRTISAVYRYDGVSKWLALDANSDRKGHLALVESSLGSGVSGALMLVRDGAGLKGKWISPDGERVLPVRFDPAPASARKRKEMAETLEKVHYENDDC